MVNAQDSQKRAPLHLAAEHGHDDCVRMLTMADDFEKDIEDDLGFTGMFR